MIKDKNNNDCKMNGENSSLDINTPTSKLLEKSGTGNKRNPTINPIIIEMYAVFSFSLLLQKLQKTVSTNAQQNKSANKNKYKISKPFEAIKNEIKDNKIIKYLDNFK